ncbi:CDP-glucose 4,6-dehydratase [Clostridium autoethanogenum]|uniref:CDP-glucose 4,6-dehydratase n=2 Tax=Clostridium autoethanogenum TaxID=84023 RepID=A0A3M0T2S6_9CLOT|nr:CDP-glucose 4,6-dehydratase [Clostridium autoethanogenum]
MKFWNGKKVLITGHTGFKGSWLSLWLQKLGAEVIGYALDPPTNPNLFSMAKVNENMISVIDDVRNNERLSYTIKKYKPEIIFHLAAQSLVRKSYKNPIETFQTNIMGTVNLLDAARISDSVKVVINVTSDKCYENKEWPWGYRETDSMGGYDPYSCSKGCSELVTNSFRNSFFKEKNIFLASARAGNVIGGGDWAEDRLVPDVIKSLINDIGPSIRNPYAVRPWQYVLEPLSGYMLLAVKGWNSNGKYGEAWNFGPDDTHVKNVEEVANSILKRLGKKFDIAYDRNVKSHESQMLKLDCSKAKSELGWYPSLNFDETVEWTANWYRAYLEKADMQQFTLDQIDKYEKLKKNI